MATVKITQDLRQSILDAASAMFIDRRNAAHKLDTRWTGQSLVDFAFEPIHDLLHHPDIQPFLTKVTTVRVQELNGTTPWEGFNVSNGFVPAPRQRAYYRHVTNPDGSEGRIAAASQYDVLTLTFENVDAVDDLKQAIAERDQRVAEIKAQQQGFTTAVKAVLDAHTTLAPALRAWPPLWELLNEKTKERHKEVVTRAKAEKPVISVDLTAATSIVTLKRMGL